MNISDKELQFVNQMFCVYLQYNDDEKIVLAMFNHEIDALKFATEKQEAHASKARVQRVSTI